MATIFSDQKQFPAVRPDGQIKTAEFLEAAKGVLNIVACFGRLLYFVYKDIEGNIKKVEKQYLSAPDRCETLQTTLQNDLENGWQKEDEGATNGGLWLKRALEFLVDCFTVLSDDHKDGRNEPISKLLYKAYELHLRNHHNLLARTTFTAVAQFLPYKEDLLLRFSYNNEELVEKMMEDMDVYTNLMRDNVQIFHKLLREYGSETE